MSAAAPMRVLWRASSAALRERRFALVASVFALLGVVAADLLAPWPLKLVVDQILLQRPLATELQVLQPLLDADPIVALIVLASTMALLAIGSGTFAYLHAWLSARVAFEVVHGLRCELYSRLSRLSLDYHARTPSGEILTRVGSDTVILRELFADWSTKAVADALLISGVLVVMFTMHAALALVVLAMLPLLFLGLRRITAAIRASARAQRRVDGALTTRLGDSLAAMPLIQAFGRESFEAARFEHDSARSRDAGIANARSAALVSRAVGLAAALAAASTALIGGVLALRGALSPGELLVFLSYVAALFKPIRDLGKLWSRFARARVSAERIAELLEREPEIVDGPEARDHGRVEGRIEFERLSFAYPGGGLVLHEASLRIEPGELVAIVGPSGAGKSTLLRLILRLQLPRGGALRIDGRPIETMTLASLRREVGVVLQDVVLEGCSIAENIRWGRNEAGDAELERAARLAGIHDFIAALPEGYATLVGQRGALLSGGQRQRISLARTLIREPAILILDEPTSAVDPASAAAIEQAIAHERRGRTTLVIGHQFRDFSRFDRVLEVRDGRIEDVTARHAATRARRLRPARMPAEAGP